MPHEMEPFFFFFFSGNEEQFKTSLGGAVVVDQEADGNRPQPLVL